MTKAAEKMLPAWKLRIASLAWILCLVAGGCSRSTDDRWTKARPPTYRVSGTVLFNGEPVEQATVIFVGRVDGQQRELAAVGQTDGQGRFRLRTFRDGDGAIAGQHVVLIQKVTSQLEKPRDEFDAPTVIEHSHLPERYRLPATSPLTASVSPAGPNDFRFALE